MLQFLRPHDLLLIYTLKEHFDLYFQFVNVFHDYDCLGRPGTMIAQSTHCEKLASGDYSIRVSFDSYKPFKHRDFINLHCNLYDEFDKHNSDGEALSFNDTIKKSSLKLVSSLAEYLRVNEKVKISYIPSCIMTRDQVKQITNHIDKNICVSLSGISTIY